MLIILHVILAVAGVVGLMWVVVPLDVLLQKWLKEDIGLGHVKKVIARLMNDAFLALAVKIVEVVALGKMVLVGRGAVLPPRDINSDIVIGVMVVGYVGQKHSV